MRRSDAQTVVDALRSKPVGAVAVVASAGGIEALCQLLGGLPKQFPMPIFIAQHLPATRESTLPKLLAWKTGFAVKWAKTAEVPQPGYAYAVPPGMSLRIESNAIVLASLSNGWQSWFDSTNALMESISRHYGAAAIGVILSGMMPAGVRGMRAIRANGGIVMAQNHATSAHFAMPMAAADEGKAEIIFSPARIAEALTVIAESRSAER